MSKRIPEAARDAVRAEIEADTVDYRDTLPEGVWTRPNTDRPQMLSLRVPGETLESLQALASSDGVPVSALVRGFILDGLASRGNDDLRQAVERLERDLALVKAQALNR
ncbi:hypothetical protein [Agrococcus baldri]|uniref:Uncharacterized protein n=1 Tax=Agrococcus baldri TaxID=153730 RepID=A0AA87RAW3_9MICO|nr:hypothetical protein [Agrococcus baldri]GEK79714.1 hypothetical protein ABA31_10650 [Agrococcus baldri]